MKCCSCRKNIPSLCQKCHVHSRQAKLKQIQRLKEMIHEAKDKYNSKLQQSFILTPQQIQKKQGYKIQYGDTKQNFQRQINILSQKQNTLVEIKKLNKKINQKKVLLQQYKQQRKQKFKYKMKCQQAKNLLVNDIIKNSELKIKEVKTRISSQSQQLKKQNQLVKMYLDEVIKKIFNRVLRLHQSSMIFEKKKLFKIVQVDELDFFKYNAEQDFMAKSVYEIQNVEEVITKQKTTQKGLHILFENILIMVLLIKIFDIWVPYPIKCEISFIQSKLNTKIQDIQICGKKLVEIMSLNITKNIIQYFPSKIKVRCDTQTQFKLQSKLITSKSESQALKETEQFLHLQLNEHANFNKRRIQLNKSFLNYLQSNIEYLSVKYGIASRPLVFYDKTLVDRILLQFLSQDLFLQMGKNKIKTSQITNLNYRSMLKEIKLNRLIESLQKQNQNDQQCLKEENDKIYQEDCQDQEIPFPQEAQKFDKKNRTISPMEQSVFELMIPQQLNNKPSSSNSSNNKSDDFEILD